MQMVFNYIYKNYPKYNKFCINLPFLINESQSHPNRKFKTVLGSTHSSQFSNTSNTFTRDFKPHSYMNGPYTIDEAF